MRLLRAILQVYHVIWLLPLFLYNHCRHLPLLLAQLQMLFCRLPFWASGSLLYLSCISFLKASFSSVVFSSLNLSKYRACISFVGRQSFQSIIAFNVCPLPEGRDVNYNFFNFSWISFIRSSMSPVSAPVLWRFSGTP